MPGRVSCNMLFKKLYILNNYSKYKFKCLLTKDPSETSSLEYIIKTNLNSTFSLLH